MVENPEVKYRRAAPFTFEGRTWPSRTLKVAPAWCSVDLRDGNQALAAPMDVSAKLKMFDLLVAMGFKEIEVGFPSASQTEFDFVRLLIEKNLIPQDVTIQVLMPAREHLIRRSMESLRGARSAVAHLYNSTSEVQRRVVFGMSRDEVKALAVAGASVMREEAARLKDNDTRIVFEYSPESFTGTEQDFALEICQAVLDVWEPSPGDKAIINLPSTVESATPNVYADRIEWFLQNLSRPDCVVLSLHAHNDRGTAVAATELALLAGAGRVEGTLFGNGERTGNADLLTLALNLYSQGIDPRLDFSDILNIADVYESCTGMKIHARHPYAGELVYTAFSGSHQDAIGKGMKSWDSGGRVHWDVPYLPIDPADVGRSYEGLVRINGQSGKGGVAYVMEKEFGYRLPSGLQAEFSARVKKTCDKGACELSPADVFKMFKREYLDAGMPYALKNFKVEWGEPEGEGGTEVKAAISVNGVSRDIFGRGNGPLDAFCKALVAALVAEGRAAFKLVSYEEHALGEGSDARAAAYICVEGNGGRRAFGAGVDTGIVGASFKAVVSAVNRMG
jgi:2-isopropylmalate synthase